MTREEFTAIACPVCEDGGTILAAVGALDAFGVPDGTVETPCPACAAGDEEAMHRIGRVSDSSSAAQVQQLGARPDESGVSGSLVRGGDPDPSLKDAA